MLGKTHMVVGMSVGLALLQPQNMMQLSVGLAASGLGALISDIDVDTSYSHREADKIIGLACVTVVLTVLADWIWHIGLYQKLMSSSNGMRILIGTILFLGICWYGKEQPHRSFMHSFLAMAILGVCVNMIFPMAAGYFLIGFASHLATDIFNFKRVWLFYPLRKGICLKWFHAHGLANTIMFCAGMCCVMLEILYFGYRIFL